jgi:hypothetical protein
MERVHPLGGSGSLVALVSGGAVIKPDGVTRGSAVGTSYTDYGGRGFWARDSVIELWLNELVASIDSSADTPAWLRKARDWWWAQASAGFTGCVSVGMDQHLGGDRARELLFMDLVRRVDERIASFGPAIPADVANSFGIGGSGAVFFGEVDTLPLRAFAIGVADLVRARPVGDGYRKPGRST